MANFTPISAAIGGALIGLSAVLLMLLNGRIAGITGMLPGILDPLSGDRGWRATFVVGLIAAPLSRCAARLSPPNRADAGELHHHRSRRPPRRLRHETE